MEIQNDRRQPALIARVIEIHECEEANDVATASLLETCIVETQRQVWFLFESSRTAVAA